MGVDLALIKLFQLENFQTMITKKQKMRMKINSKV